MPLPPVASGDPHVGAHNAERVAINALEESAKNNIVKPPGALTGDLLRWDGSTWMTTDTRFFEGTGRPDGKFAAPVGSRYIDKNAAQGAVEWVKRSGGDGNTGWLCLAGDTGLRNIASRISAGNGIVHMALVSRVGSVVDYYLDVTTPTNQGSSWVLFESLPGFGPGYVRYAGIQGNSEIAASSTAISAAGGITLLGVQGGRRDRFAGTWLTRDAWPATLPGSEF